MKTAKIFRSGNSQAVRIPKEFQLEGQEVEIRRRGDTLILRPVRRKRTALVASPALFTDDFMAGGGRQPALRRRAKAFRWKIMLDTDMCFDLIRQRPQSALNRFAAHVPGDIGLSAITVAELEYGVRKSARPRRNRQALEQFLSPLQVAAFDRAATRTYGRLRTHLERKGLPIGAMDMLIAAHALSADVSLAASNEREFRRVPDLRVENWATTR